MEFHVKRLFTIAALVAASLAMSPAVLAAENPTIDVTDPVAMSDTFDFVTVLIVDDVIDNAFEATSRALHPVPSTLVAVNCLAVDAPKPAYGTYCYYATLKDSLASGPDHGGQGNGGCSEGYRPSTGVDGDGNSVTSCNILQ